MSDNEMLYQERIDCLQRLMENQKFIMRTESENMSISIRYGKIDNDSWARLGNLHNQYYDLYQRCKKVIEPKKPF